MGRGCYPIAPADTLWFRVFHTASRWGTILRASKVVLNVVCCFPWCCVVTWKVVRTCLWCCVAFFNIKPRKFHGVQLKFHWKRLTKANHCIRVSGCSASNQRPTKRLVTAWCCLSQCLVVTWLLDLLGTHELWMTRWNLGMKNLYTGDSASAGNFWKESSGCLCGTIFWQHNVWEILK